MKRRSFLYSLFVAPLLKALSGRRRDLAVTGNPDPYMGLLMKVERATPSDDLLGLPYYCVRGNVGAWMGIERPISTKPFMVPFEFSDAETAQSVEDVNRMIGKWSAVDDHAAQTQVLQEWLAVHGRTHS